MAHFTLAKGLINWGASDYYCLQDASLDDSANIAETECSAAAGAETKRTPGSVQWALSATMLGDDASALRNAFVSGTSGAIVYQPAGAGSGLRETTGTAVIQSVTEPVQTSQHAQLNVTWLFDGTPTTADQA